MPRVGVLAAQGDFLEHIQLLRELGADVMPVKRGEELGSIDAIVLPGGESTTIGRILERRGLMEPLRRALESGLPALATCAGAILLAKRVRDRVVGEVEQPLLGVMDISVLRNAFGRQGDSFEATVEVEGFGRVRGAFIRAPAIEEAWGRARIVGYVEHPATGKVGAAAVQHNIIAVTFHPEVTGDTTLHRALLDMARGRL